MQNLASLMEVGALRNNVLTCQSGVEILLLLFPFRYAADRGNCQRFLFLLSAIQTAAIQVGWLLSHLTN